MLKKEYLFLFAIVLLATFLRLFRLDWFPPSLNWDEVSHGYNAYSILQTGRDEWGEFLPMIFRAFGDYKLPVYIYLTVPFVKLFGLTAYGVRMVSALAGVGSVVFVYFLAREFLKGLALQESKTRPGLKMIPSVAALAMAVSPWTVFLSRVAVEANLAAFFIIAGSYYFLLGVRQKEEGKGKAWGFLVSGILLGLSMFAYNSARVFVPMLVGLMGWVFRRELFVDLKVTPSNSPLKRERATCACHLVGLAVFLLFFTGMVYQLVSPEGQARFSNISVLDEGTINRINEARGGSELPDPLPRVFYNKGTFLIGRSVQGYVSYFNPKFWFVDGGDHYQFSIPGFPLIYSVNAILFVFGLSSIFIRGKAKLSKESLALIIGWILLAPIAAAPTRDNPHALRIVTIMPLPYILIGLGLYFLISKIKYQNLNIQIKNKIFAGLLVLYVLILLWQVKGFWHEYTTSYRMDYAWTWQDGHEEMVGYVKKRYRSYDYFFVTKKYGEPHEFFAFYWPWDPDKFIQNKIWDYHAEWYWVNEYERIIFVNDWEIKDQASCGMFPGAKCLLVTSPGNVPEGWRPLENIRNVKGEEVFEIYEK